MEIKEFILTERGSLLARTMAKLADPEDLDKRSFQIKELGLRWPYDSEFREYVKKLKLKGELENKILLLVIDKKACLLALIRYGN